MKAKNYKFIAHLLLMLFSGSVHADSSVELFESIKIPNEGIAVLAGASREYHFFRIADMDGQAIPDRFRCKEIALNTFPSSEAVSIALDSKYFFGGDEIYDVKRKVELCSESRTYFDKHKRIISREKIFRKGKLVVGKTRVTYGRSPELMLFEGYFQRLSLKGGNICEEWERKLSGLNSDSAIKPGKSKFDLNKWIDTIELRLPGGCHG